MLAADVETEIAGLADRYGAPRRVAVELNGRPFSPLTLADRYGEVGMVVRRPSGRLLTAIKTFYPTGAFRLLTGGVGHGERIADALPREIAEETGLEVSVSRFLAVIEYTTPGEGREASGERTTAPCPLPLASRPAFATFVFLLDEVGGTLAPQDASERIASFREVEVAELPALAETLDRVAPAFDPEIDGDWADWGRFRAVVHRVVYDTLR